MQFAVVATRPDHVCFRCCYWLVGLFDSQVKLSEARLRLLLIRYQ